MENRNKRRSGRPPGSKNFPLILHQDLTPPAPPTPSSSPPAPPSTPTPAPSDNPGSPAQSAKTSSAAFPKTPGSSSRPDLYLLGRPKHDSLDLLKLPKVKQILQRFYELAKEEDVVKSLRPKETCARKVIEEVKEVWRHHFGIRVIDGKEFGDQQVEDSDKIMIMRDILIQADLLKLEKQYHDMEYESRRKKQRKNFREKELELEKVLDTPFNILKAGKWRTMMVGEKMQRVWLPSGEEILSRSGIISWQEDLAHLRNQLTSAQPGHCNSLDVKQAKRDNRKLRDELKQDEKRKEESLKKEVSSKVVFEMMKNTSLRKRKVKMKILL